MFTVRAVDASNPVKNILKLDAKHRPGSAGEYIGKIWYNTSYSSEKMFGTDNVVCTFK